MDSFREKQNAECSVGGIHCSCCNGFKSRKTNHKLKPKLNRIVRVQMKVETEKIVLEEKSQPGGLYG